jgi:hypothetical protein
LATLNPAKFWVYGAPAVSAGMIGVVKFQTPLPP